MHYLHYESSQANCAILRSCASSRNTSNSRWSARSRKCCMQPRYSGCHMYITHTRTIHTIHTHNTHTQNTIHTIHTHTIHTINHGFVLSTDAFFFVLLLGCTFEPSTGSSRKSRNKIQMYSYKLSLRHNCFTPRCFTDGAGQFRSTPVIGVAW